MKIFVLLLPLLFCTNAFGLESKAMILTNLKGGPHTYWTGLTQTPKWTWGLLPMTEAIADQIAALDPSKKYACSVKSVEMLAYSPSYIAAVYEITDCKVTE